MFNMDLQHRDVVMKITTPLEGSYHLLAFFATGAGGAEGAIGATVAECLFPIARTFSYRLLVLMS